MVQFLPGYTSVIVCVGEIVQLVMLLKESFALQLGTPSIDWQLFSFYRATLCVARYLLS